MNTVAFYDTIPLVINKRKITMNKKVLIAMSGGVDSSAAALLLKQGGNTPIGVTLKLFCAKDIGDFENELCVNSSDINDAKEVCDKLGIDHEVLDLSSEFSKRVMDSFTHTYLCGKTPNPCIECNRHIKFSAISKYGESLGYTHIATGHYCSIQNANGRYLLKKAVDESKDQTYVLYMLSQEQLSKTLFPLGGMTKSEVREIAEKNGLINARKRDSQDICFVKDGNYRSFIEFRTGKTFQKGDFCLADGTKLGTHNGIIGYTVGQRKGLGVSYTEPLYVVDKDVDSNIVTLGKESELYSTRVEVENVNFIPFDKLDSPMRAYARLRYHQKESACTIHPVDNGRVMLEFDTPQRAVTPGQAAVFYDGEYVVGGGTITRVVAP